MDNTINLGQSPQKEHSSGLRLEIYKSELKSKIETLKKICDTLDPYEEISSQVKDQLEALGITDLDNPFTLTNQLLFQMENAIEELQNL